MSSPSSHALSSKDTNSDSFMNIVTTVESKLSSCKKDTSSDSILNVILPPPTTHASSSKDTNSNSLMNVCSDSSATVIDIVTAASLSYSDLVDSEVDGFKQELKAYVRNSMINWLKYYTKCFKCYEASPSEINEGVKQHWRDVGFVTLADLLQSYKVLLGKKQPKQHRSQPKKKQRTDVDQWLEMSKKICFMLCKKGGNELCKQLCKTIENDLKNTLLGVVEFKKKMEFIGFVNPQISHEIEEMGLVKDNGLWKWKKEDLGPVCFNCKDPIFSDNIECASVECSSCKIRLCFQCNPIFYGQCLNEKCENIQIVKDWFQKVKGWRISQNDHIQNAAYRVKKFGNAKCAKEGCNEIGQFSCDVAGCREVYCIDCKKQQKLKCREKDKSCDITTSIGALDKDDKKCKNCAQSGPIIKNTGKCSFCNITMAMAFGFK